MPDSSAITLIILIVLSGLFSGTEIAIFSITDARLRSLVKDNISGANALQSLRKKTQKLLVTILIGNNVVNILAASMATAIAIDTLEVKELE